MAQYSSQNRYYRTENYAAGNRTNAGVRTAYHQRMYEESLKNQQYMYEAAAPSYDIPEEIRPVTRNAAPKRDERRTPDTERRQARRTKAAPSVKFNFAGFMIVLASFAFLAVVMLHYVQALDDFYTIRKTTASDEVLAESKATSNDEYLTRIESSIDLDEIARRAKDDLHMSYASEGQIITYTSAGNDYMRKVDSN